MVSYSMSKSADSSEILLNNDRWDYDRWDYDRMKKAHISVPVQWG